MVSTWGKVIARLVVVLALLAGGAWSLSAPAAGQGYPGTTQPPGNSGPARENRAQVLGAGESRTFEECGFQPNSSANLTLNGAEAGTDNAESDGCVRVEVRAGSSTPCTLTVNGRTFTTNQRDNTLVVDGTGSNGAARTITYSVSVSCTQAASLPRTGSSYTGWVLVAAALIVVGLAAVIIERRKLTRR